MTNRKCVVCGQPTKANRHTCSHECARIRCADERMEAEQFSKEAQKWLMKKWITHE